MNTLAKVIQTEDYTSQDTSYLTIPEMEEMLLAQPEIIAELKNQELRP